MKAKSRLGMTKMPQHHLDICDRFKTVRLESNMTQAEFAQVLDLNLSYVKMIETQKVTPNIYAIKQLHAVFRRGYNWIIDGEGGPK